jgi:protein-S-isoprenylcysteine O-methyltransferase Ste14
LRLPETTAIQNCHCERSEAISKSFSPGFAGGLLRATSPESTQEIWPLEIFNATISTGKRTWNMQQNQSKTNKKPSYLKIMIRMWLFVFLISISIFILAGRINYWQGWLFITGNISFFIIQSISLANKKDLAQERDKPGLGTKPWDKFFFPLYWPASISIFAVAALDAGRFSWTAKLPPLVYIISYTACVLSLSLFLWAIRANKFFSSVVRIQTDRGHYVIRSGPYRFIRHPGYLAAIFAFISVAPALGSLWALIPASLVAFLFIIRTYLEDKTLKKELPGYSEYAQDVKFRLLPHIW